MIRYLLIFWAIPLGSFWGWFSLSYFNVGFGTVYFTRGFHDLYFNICGELLGMPAEQVPILIAKACVIDTLVIFGLIAIGKWRNVVRSISKIRFSNSLKAAPASDQVRPVE